MRESSKTSRACSVSAGVALAAGLRTSITPLTTPPSVPGPPGAARELRFARAVPDGTGRRVSLRGSVRHSRQAAPSPRPETPRRSSSAGPSCVTTAFAPMNVPAPDFNRPQDDGTRSDRHPVAEHRRLPPARLHLDPVGARNPKSGAQLRCRRNPAMAQVMRQSLGQCRAERPPVPAAPAPDAVQTHGVKAGVLKSPQQPRPVCAQGRLRCGSSPV